MDCSDCTCSFNTNRVNSQWIDAGEGARLHFRAHNCVTLSLCSRKDTFNTVPAVLFSSLKYRLFVSLDLAKARATLPSHVNTSGGDLSFLMAKLEVLDASTKDVIPMKGTLTTSVSPSAGGSPTEWRSGELLPLLEPSQRHSDALFCFRVCLKHPQGQLISIIESAPFRVLARKPTVQPGVRSLTHKRKVDTTDPTDMMSKFRRLPTTKQSEFLSDALAFFQQKTGASFDIPKPATSWPSIGQLQEPQADSLFVNELPCSSSDEDEAWLSAARLPQELPPTPVAGVDMFFSCSGAPSLQGPPEDSFLLGLAAAGC
eukprot:TRINITY_DN52965_c0_g1_i1.p1 TRINITY_DN52965_c0_g1~~TRINITY_DN52965_c0_g1_i1.p1  ORF type:complete len:315 (-),score=13.75 TRINITY_DN52965_c0_g1_i1:262-1206(-)